MSIMVSEIYGPVGQGEGAVIGTPTVFVRLGGCDYRCSWCDSLYAVETKFKDEWRKLTPTEIMEEVSVLVKGPLLITLSGGNPALQDLTELIDLGHNYHFTFAIETQGTIMRPWARKLDHVTLSPKPPSSGMLTNWDQLDRWLSMVGSFRIESCLKVVVFDEADYAYAGIIRNRAQVYGVPMFLQAGTSDPYGQTDTYEGRSIFRERILERLDWLSQKVIADGWYDVRVLPQLHALIYGAKRGV